MQFREYVPIERVADLCATSPCGNEVGLTKNLEMLADGWLADIEIVREVAGARLRLVGEPEHNPQANRMAERFQALLWGNGHG